MTAIVIDIFIILYFDNIGNDWNLTGNFEYYNSELTLDHGRFKDLKISGFETNHLH